jgi:hypothetical protein
MHFYNSTAFYVNDSALLDRGECSLAAAGFTDRQRQNLAFYGNVFTASDISDKSDAELLRIPGFGRQLLQRLRALVWAQ